MIEIIGTTESFFHSDVYALVVRVYRLDSGLWAIELTDTDSGLKLPVVTRRTREGAELYARACLA